MICAISVGRIAPQWKDVGGGIVWVPFNVCSAVVCVLLYLLFVVSEYPSLVMPDLRREETDCCGDEMCVTEVYKRTPPADNRYPRAASFFMLSP